MADTSYPRIRDARNSLAFIWLDQEIVLKAIFPTAIAVLSEIVLVFLQYAFVHPAWITYAILAPCQVLTPAVLALYLSSRARSVLRDHFLDRPN
ncbi:MAG: hypothetical protein HY376_03710 [Candidatus Blackburnbacteria bacterium]|nr:hypothetical protein [Candidatus Blackburnbacteria bacterium]